MSLAEALGASGVVGDRVSSNGTRPACHGTGGNDRATFIRTPRETPAHEAVRSCASTSRDLEKLLDHSRCRRDRQAYKGADVQRHARARWPLARKLAPFWAALRGRGSQHPLRPFDYPIFYRFFQKAVADLTLPPIVPYQWRHSGSSIDIAHRARSLEQVKKLGRWQVMKTVQRHERQPTVLSVATALARRRSDHGAPTLACCLSHVQWEPQPFQQG